MDITVENYVENAIRTESNDFNKIRDNLSDSNIRLLHSAMGLCTEIEEMVNHVDLVNLKEEIGDTLWYLAIAKDELKGLPRADVNINENIDIMNSIFTKSATFLDLMKKTVFYSKKTDRDNILKLTTEIYLLVSRLCDEKGFDIDDIASRNIKKLKARYPEKFSDDKAENRDLEKEKEILSK